MHVDWTEATAIGTLSLAVATFVLALKTRTLADSASKELALLERQNEQAQRQSVAAEAALSASILPVLVDVPRPTWRQGPTTTRINREGLGTTATESVDLSKIGSESADERFYLRVPLRNVGPGLALIIAAAVTSARRGERPVVPGTVPSVIAAGEVGAVFFNADTQNETGTLLHLLTLGDDLIVEVGYTDVAGRQLAASQIRLRQGSTGGEFFAGGVDLLSEPELTRP